MSAEQFKQRSLDSNYNVGLENFKDDDLFFGSHLYTVRWTAVFKKAAPKLASERRDFILMVAGTSTINPVIILSWLMIENKIDNEGSDTDFRQEVKAFAEDLLNQYMDATDMSHSNSDNAALPLLKVLGEDYDKLQRFFVVYAYTKKEIDDDQRNLNADSLQYFRQRLQTTKQQDQALEEILIMPYPVDECWNICNINVFLSFIQGYNIP